jgi:hypothetical protein
MSRPVRVLAVVDSDSNLKWAGGALSKVDLGDGAFEISVVVLQTPLAPSMAQITSALSGTGLPAPLVLRPGALRQRIRRDGPDAVLVAAIGPVAEYIADIVVRATRQRPALVSGLPGIALTGTRRAVRWRDWTDAFLVHSRREAEEVGQEFAALKATPRIVLSSLPYLRHHAHDPTPIRRLVFAPQAKVPVRREDRVALLDGLARLADDGFEVIVKLRARAGERQTHNERYPLDELWRQEHARLGRTDDDVVFSDGPMDAWLTPGTALVTISSTAAIESLALGLPTAVIADFGVSAELLNEPFAGSGFLVSMADLPRALRAGGPVADAAWLDRNYLHTSSSELPAALAELAERREIGELPPLRRVRPRRFSSRLRTLARVYLPSCVHRRLNEARSRASAH